MLHAKVVKTRQQTTGASRAEAIQDLAEKAAVETDAAFSDAA